MLGGSLFTTAWRVLRLQMEETASRYAGYLPLYCLGSRGQPTGGGSVSWRVGRGLTIPHCTIFSCYLIFKRASVRKEISYNILFELGILWKLVGLIKTCLNENCYIVRIDKNLSRKYPIQNGLKLADALSSLLFNTGLEYASRRVQENQEGENLNGTDQILSYADVFNIAGENIDTIQKTKSAIGCW
jgi:hypothetical protein